MAMEECNPTRQEKSPWASRRRPVDRQRRRDRWHAKAVGFWNRGGGAGEQTILFAVFALFALQYAGALIASLLRLPIPATVIGMVLLLVALAIRGGWPGPRQAVPDALNNVAGALHGHFGLLFVPAGVGVVENIDRLRADGPVLLGVVLLSTATAIAVTAAIMAGARSAGRAEPVSAE